MILSNKNTGALRVVLGALLLLLAPLAFTACQPEPVKIDITIDKEYSQIIDAIKGVDKTLAQKLAAIEAAVQDGFADDKAAKELITAAVASLSGKAADKLATVEAAVQAQTASFETKLALIEAAAREGFASGAAQQELLRQALEALGGTLEEKIAAIEKAVTSQTASLETKIGLVEAALREGLADGTSAQELLKAAIESTGGTLAEKIAAIEKAIGSQTTDLSAKLGLIETAVKEGFAEAKAKQALIQTALDSLSGTAEEKLAAIEKAVTGQTTSLETKLDLIDAAVSDPEAAYELLKKALESLGGTLAAKLAAIEAAIGSETTDLSAKLGLIETAVKEGLTGEVSQQALIATALDSLSDDLEGKLAALEKAVTSQTSSLETKLIAIETAVSKGFASEKDQLDLIRKAIETLSGTTEKKLEAIEKVVTSQTTSLGTKLAAIETALKNGIGSVATAEGQIQQALTSLAGTAADKLGEIVKALSDQKTSLDTYLSLIEQAIKNGFADSKDKQDLIEKAIKGLGDTVEVVMKKLQEAMSGPLSGLDTKLAAIGKAVTDGFADGTKALGLIKDAVIEAQKSIASADTSVVSVTNALRDVITAIEDTDKTITNEVAAALTKILDAIVAPPDYSKLLEEIKQAIEAIQPVSITFDEYVSEESGEDVLIMPVAYSLNVPYTLSSESKVTATATEGITATVIPDVADPLKGCIEIKTPATIEEGKSKVEVTIGSTVLTSTHTLYIKPVKMEKVSVDRKDLKYTGCDIEFKYRANLPVYVAVHDTCKWARIIQQSPSANTGATDSSIFVEVDPNKGIEPLHTSVTVTDCFGSDSLKFYINQDYNSEIIVFEESDMGAYLTAEGKSPVVDLNHDGKISKAEAALVKSLSTLFDTGGTEGRVYRSFNEFQYFTGIDTLPDGSFNNWTYLESIKLPEGIKVIATGYGDCRGIFQNCPKLKSIEGKFTHDNTIIYNNQLLRVAPNVVYDGQFIPDGVEIIGSRAVTGSKTSDLFIPQSVKKIRDYAFAYSDIETIRFAMTTDDPGTGKAFVDSIAETAFNYCFKLKKFIGPKNNGSLRVTPDQLGLIRDTTFYAYALGADEQIFSIPENLEVRKIVAGAFDLTDENGKPKGIKLQHLGLPATVNHIRSRAFRNTQYINVWFKAENPPVRVEDEAFSWAKEFIVRFPAVMDGDAVDRIATDEREDAFRKALGETIGLSEYTPPEWDIFK